MNDYFPPPAPVCCHLLEQVAITLPFWRYCELYADSPYSFLLDSAKQSARLGRYSFIGGDPTLVFRAKRVQDSGFRVQNSSSSLEPIACGLQPVGRANIELIELADSGGQPLEQPVTTRLIGPPFEVLRQVMAAHRVDYDQYATHPAAFLSGAVGYFGYEAGHFIEDLPDSGADDLALPDVYLMFVSTVLVHCHRTGRTYLSVLGRGEDEEAARRHAEIQKEKMLARVADFQSKSHAQSHLNMDEPQTRPTDALDIRSHFDQSSYCRAIQTIKDHISAGDVYQVCLTRRLEAPLVGGTAWDLYQVLRRLNPAPFAAFLRFPEVQVVSSSPERFLSLGPDRVAESRPIKGTRPRGATPEDDQRMCAELAASPKDQAENLMIVDLVRNDLGRVCRFRSIEVPEFMLIEDYATVFQMVSTIRGRLAEGRDALDLIQASFPGGSMTGAPKIEAMKIIDRLEPVNRGIYSGTIGYLDFAGPMDLSIVIRTIVVAGGRCFFHAGGGIVADSEPAAEFNETEDKARALVDALRILKTRR